MTQDYNGSFPEIIVEKRDFFVHLGFPSAKGMDINFQSIQSMVQASGGEEDIMSPVKSHKSVRRELSRIRPVEPLIISVRGQKVILDSDLAEIYGVPTKRLNEQVRRNADRFPEDFVFHLTAQEGNNLKSQFATSSWESAGNEENTACRPRLTAGRSHGGRRKLPYAFTEHGAIMAATVLNSPEAAAMSVFVVRAFVRMREQLAANAAILKRLAEIDKTLLEHDRALAVIWEQIQPLLTPPPDPPKRRIGFHAD